MIYNIKVIRGAFVAYIGSNSQDVQALPFKLIEKDYIFKYLSLWNIIFYDEVFRNLS